MLFSSNFLHESFLRFLQELPHACPHADFLEILLRVRPDAPRISHTIRFANFRAAPRDASTLAGTSDSSRSYFPELLQIRLHEFLRRFILKKLENNQDKSVHSKGCPRIVPRRELLKEIQAKNLEEFQNEHLEIYQKEFLDEIPQRIRGEIHEGIPVGITQSFVGRIREGTTEDIPQKLPGVSQEKFLEEFQEVSENRCSTSVVDFEVSLRNLRSTGRILKSTFPTQLPRISDQERLSIL